jgi:D,D-heptose 1,7-bisphosphate phosphatase
MPGVAASLPGLAAAGYRLVVVTNQSGVARGLFSEDELRALGAYLSELFRQVGARLEGFYYCPHYIAGAVPEYAIPCDCRKPLPGLISRAAAELSLDLTQSWLIGDALSDIAAAHAAGVRAVLVDWGRVLPPESGAERPDHIAPSFAEAVRLVTQSQP